MRSNVDIAREYSRTSDHSGPDSLGRFTPVFKFHGSKFDAGYGAINFADLAAGLLSQVKPIEHPCAMRLIGQLWKQPSRTSSTESFTPMSSGPKGEPQPDDIVASATSGVTWSAACMSGSNPKLKNEQIRFYLRSRKKW